MPDRLDQIQVGDSAELKHRITLEDVQGFSSLTGDDNPLHMDDDYAKALGFGRRVVHGMLTASFISTMIGTKLPGAGSLWYEQTIRFLRPVRVGETIRVRATVLQKSVAQRIIVLETIVLGEAGDHVLEGQAKVKMLEQKAKEYATMRSPTQGAVIVTGASRGIGAAVAMALARTGHSVVVNCMSSMDQGAEVVEAIRSEGGAAMLYQADVRSPDQVAAMVGATLARLGPLDGVVHNASAPVNPVPMAELTWEQMKEHLDIQLQGAYNLFHSMIAPLAAQGAGLFLSIGSTFIDNTPPLQLAHYVAAKSALTAFTKCIAAEYGPKGIRAMCISPGMTQTTLIAGVPEKARMVAKMQAPLRRLGTPEDVSGLAAFLFSPGAAYLTGQNIRLSGGSIMV
ncbi:SDR family oxidoreductase [Solidesulfovibrio sp.]